MCLLCQARQEADTGGWCRARCVWLPGRPAAPLPAPARAGGWVPRQGAGGCSSSRPGDAHLRGERAVLCPLCLWAGRCFLGHREVTNRACDFSLSQRVGLYVRYLAERGQCVQTELRARWLVARILRALLLQAGARSHQSRTGSGVRPPLSQHFVHQWAQPGGLCVQRCRRAAPCTVHETVPGSNQTPESGQAQQRAGPRERAGRRAETPGCTPSPAAFTAPEAPLPRSPLYSEHKRH